MLFNITIIRFENKKEFFLEFRWRNVLLIKGFERMLVMIKGKGMNGGRLRKKRMLFYDFKSLIFLFLINE